MKKGHDARETQPSRSYPDLHDQLDALDKAGLLLKIDIPINKDTEIHPLMRWQFRGGLDENDRKAMLFTNVVDAKGKKYDIPVIIGAMGGSRKIYQIGLGHPPDQVGAVWTRAMNNLIPPRTVDNAPCQQVVIEGLALDRPGGALEALPVPISTPGWDNGPYLTTSAFITRDPDTGVQNLGNYRAQVKSPRWLGMNPSVELKAGGYLHWLKYKALGKPMPTAVVVGLPPAIAYASVQKAPETIDEISLAGGLVGSPINVVKARTVDLMVPAEAILMKHTLSTLVEIVIGFMSASAVGIAIGAAITLSTSIRQAFYPNIVFFQLIPKAAVAPLFVLWLGFGSPSRLAFSVFMAFFPIAAATAAGLANTKGDAVRLCRSLTATNWQTFTNVRLPFAIPFVFAGLKVGLTMAMIGIIVGEFITGQEGLGYVIMFASSAGESAPLYAALLILATMGLGLYSCLLFVEVAVQRWYGAPFSSEGFA